MTASVQSATPQSSVEGYAARRSRALEAATEAGLSGILVAPGPDLVWLTGYQPTAITERLTPDGTFGIGGRPGRLEQ